MRISDWSSDVCSSDLSFAQSLLQSRHGVLNLHKVPATHIGDFGIDYYCLADLVIYQCYAVEEPIDIAIRADRQKRSEEHTSELQSLMRISYAVFCLKKKKETIKPMNIQE